MVQIEDQDNLSNQKQTTQELFERFREYASLPIQIPEDELVSSQGILEGEAVASATNIRSVDNNRHDTSISQEKLKLFKGVDVQESLGKWGEPNTVGHRTASENASQEGFRKAATES